MKHESMRQLLALNLYDELDSPEREQLALHLEVCDDCRRFEAELRDGLGACLEEAPHAPELPSDWRERLSRVTSPPAAAPARTSGSLPWWTAAAGFAACWLFLSALGWAPRAPEAPQDASNVPVLAQFSRATPPPLAQSNGGWGQWLEMRGGAAASRPDQGREDQGRR